MRTFVLGTIGLVLAALLLVAVANKMPTASNDGGAVAATPTIPFILTDLSTTWRLDSAAYAGVAGGLWVPEIQFTIQNTRSRDIGPLYFRGRFSDSAGTLEGDDVIQSVQDVPSGYRRGPIFVVGTQGYTSDFAFLPMMQSTAKLWRYELYYATAYGGQYAELRSGTVDLPRNYRQFGGQP